METIDLTEILTLLAALAFVIALMAGLSFVMKKLGVVHGGAIVNDKRRLNIVEALPLDNRRRAVILRCDEEEHLVILGPESEILVKTDLKAPDEKNTASDQDKA